MHKYPRYEQYKDSGIEWLGRIPAHWLIKKTKYLFRLVTDIAPKGNTHELLSIYTDIGVRPRRELEERGNKATTTTGYWIVKKGDIIVNKLLAWMGAIGVSKYDGVTSPAYDILRKRTGVNTSFFDYLFRCGIMFPEFKKHSRGIMEMRLRLYYDQFGQIKLMVPPLAEQSSIVKFLSYKLAHIDQFITKKEKLIALLKEQKAAVINRAVTKGIDPHVRLKPSGIEWLGEIPAHWEVKKLKYVAKINPPKSNKKYYRNSNEPVTFLPMEKVSTTGEISNELKMPISKLWTGYTYFEKHDVLLAKITPCFENGKGAYLDKLDTEIGFGTTEFHVLRATNAMIPKFLHYFLKTASFLKLGKENMIGTAGQKRLLFSFVANFPIAFPSKEKQLAIVNYIERQNDEIEQALSKTLKEIELIREYRTTLISEAVTGKIKVPGLGAGKDRTLPTEKYGAPDLAFLKSHKTGVSQEALP